MGSFSFFERAGVSLLAGCPQKPLYSFLRWEGEGLWAAASPPLAVQPGQRVTVGREQVSGGNMASGATRPLPSW